MSTVTGVLFGGITTAATVYQAVSPSQANSAKAILAAINGVESAIRDKNIRFDGADTEALKSALSELNGEAAKASQLSDGTFPFVPRSYVGVETIPLYAPYDFVAPNGVQKLLRFTFGTGRTSHLRIMAEGEFLDGRLEPGENAQIDFDGLVCRFELISFTHTGFEEGSATIRSSCA